MKVKQNSKTPLREFAELKVFSHLEVDLKEKLALSLSRCEEGRTLQG